MRKDGFTVCANKHVECLRREGRYATAHVVELRVCHSDKSPVRI